MSFNVTNKLALGLFFSFDFLRFTISGHIRCECVVHVLTRYVQIKMISSLFISLDHEIVTRTTVVVARRPSPVARRRQCWQWNECESSQQTMTERCQTNKYNILEKHEQPENVKIAFELPSKNGLVTREMYIHLNSERNKCLHISI